MDLFDYAGELFNRHGVLHVPGLGHFAKIRKSSYYSDGAIHPPLNQINFQYNAGDENDELVSYFATQKRISPASARYFVDKLVTQLKEQANTGEFAFADLGTFYTDNGTLAFKARQSSPENDPALFGLAPVAFEKLAERKDRPVTRLPRLEEHIEPEQAIPMVPENTAASQPQADNQPRQKDTEVYGSSNDIIILNSSLGRDPESGISAMLWTLYAVVAMAIVGAFLWYYNTHNLANEKVNAENNPVNQSYNAQKAKSKTAGAAGADLDTATNKALSADSAAALSKNKAVAMPVQAPQVNTNNIPAPELFKNSWVVSGGQNNNYAGAARLVTRYRSQGYPQARMIDSVKKKEWFIYRVIFDFYDTKQQAIAARRQLLKDGKLNAKYITVQPTIKDQ